jgi:hypothetical protein
MRIYELIDAIKTRYSAVRFDAKDDESFQEFLRSVNTDREIQEFAQLSNGGAIATLREGEKTPFGGFGTNLCVGPQGLYVYDFNDYEGKSKEITSSPETLKQFGMTSQKLRDAIVKFFDRDAYIKHVAEFNSFRH